MKAISLNQFLKKQKQCTIIDLRHQLDFIKGFVPDSLFVGIEGPFEKWMHLVVPNQQTPILCIFETNMETLIFQKLQDLGYQNIQGYLKGGFSTWESSGKNIHKIDSIDVETYESIYTSEQPLTFDVRKESEYEKQSLPNTQLHPLEINLDFIKKINTTTPFYLFCGGGYRSVIALSYLKKHHIDGINIEGGFKAISETTIINNKGL